MTIKLITYTLFPSILILRIILIFFTHIKEEKEKNVHPHFRFYSFKFYLELKEETMKIHQKLHFGSDSNDAPSISLSQALKKLSHKLTNTCLIGTLLQ